MAGATAPEARYPCCLYRLPLPFQPTLTLPTSRPRNRAHIALSPALPTPRVARSGAIDVEELSAALKELGMVTTPEQVVACNLLLSPFMSL